MLPLIDTILNILFPERCLGCGVQDTPICDECLADLPIALDNQEQIKALWAYADPTVRALVQRLKYRRARFLTKILGKSLAEFVMEEVADLALFGNLQNFVIIPAPMSSKRLRQRGFNQAELLACEVARATGIALVTDAIAKKVHTSPQVSLSKKARLTNLSHAFEVFSATKIKNKNIILIDDVYTTGTTIKEISLTLSAQGAKSIHAYTLAH